MPDETRIARGRLDPAAAAQPDDNRQLFTERERSPGEAVVKAVLDGRVLETIPIKEYVRE